MKRASMGLKSNSRRRWNSYCLTTRRRKRCNTTSSRSASILISVALALSLISWVPLLVRSFRCTDLFGSHFGRPWKRHGSTLSNNKKKKNNKNNNNYNYCPTCLTASSLFRELDSIDDLKVGSLILSRVETSLGCHDLRQPYFHKAVVLVLDHDPDDFTQGVILNRASDLVLDGRDIVYIDDNDEESTDDAITSTNWRIHFGGDIGGWYEEAPQLLCLHGISSEAARAVSDPIFDNDDETESNVYITSHRGALSLVQAGEAKADMFFTFSGFCGWEEGQLAREVERGSWCLAEFSSKNTQEHPFLDLVENYSWKNPDYQPQSGGLEFWHQVMADLGKDGVQRSLPKNPQPFSDLMVKEWATQLLLVGGGDEKSATTFEDEQPTSQIDDQDIFRALKAESNQLSNGSILRGSSAVPSPYLVNSQLFHKSTILVLQDTPEASIGVILNLPTKNVYVLTVKGKDYEIPIRYGGYSGKQEQEGEEPQYFWFHNHQTLKEEDFGLPVSFSSYDENAQDLSCVYACDIREVRQAIDLGLATAKDFLLVKGFCAWEKQGSAGGLAGQIRNGNLEDTQWFQKKASKQERLWKCLLDQKLPTTEVSLQDNLELSQMAWEQGGDAAAAETAKIRRVFDSSITVSELADDALFVWMKLFLLRDAVYLPTDF